MDIAGIAESPFTGSQQIIEWPGASFWLAKVELPPMTRDGGAAAWLSFLAYTHGIVRTFMLGPTDAKTPRGAAGGTPLIKGIQVKDSFDLATDGWPINTPNVLKRGDWLEVENRLHMNMEDEASDASGNASFTIWPACRAAYADNATIIVNSSRGTFRLASPRRELYDADAAKIYNIAFTAVEAR